MADVDSAIPPTPTSYSFCYTAAVVAGAAVASVAADDAASSTMNVLTPTSYPGQERGTDRACVTV